MKLGDTVALVAQPIAKGIDVVFGTDVENCGGCKQRQQQLNQLGDEIVDHFHQLALTKRKKKEEQNGRSNNTSTNTV